MLTDANLVDLAATERPITATVTKVEVITWLDGTPMGRGPGCTESLAEGVREDMPPLDPTLIIKGCPFFREAFVTGGKDFNQPQWMYTTLATTWMEKGKELAHALGKGHPGYTPDSTEEMFARKERDRAANPSLGWPTCRAIEQTGFGGCAGCPHRNAGKSPLHLAEAKIVAKPNPPAQGTTLANFTPAAAPVDKYVDLPDGYHYDNGIIIADVMPASKKGEDDGLPPTPIEVALFTCVIKNAWLEKGAVNFLHFEFSADIKATGGRHWRVAQFDWGDLAKSDRVYSTMASAGVIPAPKIKGEVLKEFFMSWLKKMQDAAEANETVPYGWYNDTEGFAFDKVLYMKDGTERPAGARDDVIERFTRHGPDDIQPWLNAFETVRTLTSPANMIGVCAAFASPLMKFTGEKGAVLSLFGRTNGGKTSSSKLGMSVWGDPSTSGGTSNATFNSLPDTFVALQNLPFYFDDPRKEQMPKVREMAFIIANGTGKMRSEVHKSTGKVGLAPVKKFCMSGMVNTNFSIFEGVPHAERNGDAGPARVLEIIVPSVLEDPKKMDGGIAADLLAKLDNHYGQMGHRYAKHIAINADRIAERIKVWRDWFDEQCKPPVGSFVAGRYWRALCATIMVGAEEGSALGIPFELDRMRDCLVVEYTRNQADVLELNLDTAGGTAIDIEGTLAKFLNTNVHVTVATDIYQVGAGRSALVMVNVLKPMPLNSKENCAIHFVRNDRLLRINRKYLSDWCITTKEAPPNSFVKGLQEMFGATQLKKQTLAPRTSWPSVQVTAIHIKILPGSMLEPMLDAYITATVLAEEAAAAAQANDNTPLAQHSLVDTGKVA